MKSEENQIETHEKYSSDELNKFTNEYFIFKTKRKIIREYVFLLNEKASLDLEYAKKLKKLASSEGKVKLIENEINFSNNKSLSYLKNEFNTIANHTYEYCSRLKEVLSQIDELAVSQRTLGKGIKKNFLKTEKQFKDSVHVLEKSKSKYSFQKALCEQKEKEKVKKQDLLVQLKNEMEFNKNSLYHSKEALLKENSDFEGSVKEFDVAMKNSFDFLHDKFCGLNENFLKNLSSSYFSLRQVPEFIYVNPLLSYNSCLEEKNSSFKTLFKVFNNDKASIDNNLPPSNEEKSSQINIQRKDQPDLQVSVGEKEGKGGVLNNTQRILDYIKDFTEGYELVSIEKGDHPRIVSIEERISLLQFLSTNRSNDISLSEDCFNSICAIFKGISSCFINDSHYESMKLVIILSLTYKYNGKFVCFYIKDHSVFLEEWFWKGLLMRKYIIHYINNKSIIKSLFFLH